MWDALPTVAVVGFIGLVILLSVIIWSIRSHRDPKLQIDCDSPIDELIPSLAGLTLGAAVRGNSVEVFENGAFFEALLASGRFTWWRDDTHWNGEGIDAAAEVVARVLAQRGRA